VSDATKHAILSPSGADRWMVCPGSVKLSKGKPDNANVYSTEGTDMHEVAALCLEEDKQAADLVGCEMQSGSLLNEEQSEAIQNYVDAVRTYRDAVKGALKIEEKVPLTQITGEPEAEGTVDALIISQETEIVVIDAKFGRGVQVNVENNRQTKIYAIGALDKHELWDYVKTVRLVICQPRLKGTSERVVTVEELAAFKTEVGQAAQRVATEPDLLVPSDKGCKFCRAKAVCPALRDVSLPSIEGFEVEDSMDAVVANETKAPVVPERSEDDELEANMAKIPQIETWIKAIRAEVERRLLAGVPLKHWKLVQGKNGARQWTDEDDAVKKLKEFRLKKDQMYEMSLISPTSAEKLLKKIAPNQWKALQEVIIQKPGPKSVAPMSDDRPAILVGKPLGGFAVEPEEWSDLI